MCLTSCEGTLDDIFGEWSRPTGNNGNTKTTVAVKSVTLDQTTLTKAVGDDAVTLTATVDPTDASDKTVTWKSSDASIAAVDANGKVTFVAAGSATITATATNGTDDTADDKTATCEVTISAKKVNVESVKLDQPTLTATVGDAAVTLTATVTPDDATDKTVKWTSSNESVATVADGVVTFVAAGTATITATAPNGTDDTADDKTATCEVTISAKKVNVESVTLDKPTLTATVGDPAVTLKATVTPDDATDKTVTWKSSDETVAIVADGVVTFVAAGTATITAKAGDKTATCEVTVTPGLATPLTVEAITQGKITVTSPQAGMKYSKDGGVTKLPVSANPTNIPVAAGEKVSFYGTANCYNGTKIGGADDGGTFKCKVYGNIMSLLYEDFATNYNTLPANDTFRSLFNGNAKLTDISDLQLPATTLTESCYQNMFKGCTSLTTIPEALLPATTLAESCYQNMFNGCTGLTTVPEKLLPATELKDGCYSAMFQGCTELTTATELPATTLTKSCYWGMFSGCSNLIATPHLAAPTSELVGSCYQSMFYNCTSLIKAYVKADYKNTSGIYECEWMFKGCPSSGDFYTNGDWSTAEVVSGSGWTKHSYE